METAIQKSETAPSSSSQPQANTDPSKAQISRKRTRSSDNQTFANLLEYLSSPTLQSMKKEIEENRTYGDDTFQHFLQRTLSVMYKFMKQFFDHLCSMSQSTQEIHHWKTIMCTSFWLLHNYAEQIDLSLDDVALTFACMYLAGKAEHFFIKTDKLRTIGQKFVTDCFGKEVSLPSDSVVSKESSGLFVNLIFLLLLSIVDLFL